MPPVRPGRDEPRRAAPAGSTPAASPPQPSSAAASAASAASAAAATAASAAGAAGASSLPLAHGELSERDAAELAVLKEQIRAAVGFACEGYKERCLRRRIAVRMRARGVHGYADYARLLREDDAEYEVLADTLTINVSKFYRNPDVWEVVASAVLPELYGRPDPVINAWSAGTASGEEAYTIAMLAHDHALDRAVANRVRILGTDIDRESLSWAERAEYNDFAMGDIDTEVRDRWFDHHGTWRLRPEARRHVRFGTLDLIRDPYPEHQHVIFCRNVIIYFERSVQQTLFRRFHDALLPGGFLVLGKVEALFGEASGLFKPVANRQRVFRRA
jgi:chemotaxis protein methyltransferase CheR